MGKSQSRFPWDLIFPEPVLALAFPHRVSISIYKRPEAINLLHDAVLELSEHKSKPPPPSPSFIALWLL